MKKLFAILLILTLALCVCLSSCDIALDLGDKIDTDTSEKDTPTAEIVTDADGNAVTNENGEVVTVLPEPETEIGTEIEIVTDADGNDVTDENGEVVTNVIVNTSTTEEAGDPDAVESNPETEDNTSAPSIPSVTPIKKSPYAWHAAAYRTLAELTNGTLRFAEETKVEGYKGAQTAILKISQHTYSMHDAAGNFLCAWVDGILYDPFSKVAMPIPEEEFCKDAFPYYPLSNAMLPLTEENFAGISFTEEAETVSFTLHLTAEEYAELTGSPLGGKITEVIYTVVFDASTTLMQSVTAKAIFDAGEGTAEYYSTITVELSALGTTAPITAPEDADKYQTVGGSTENNNGAVDKPPMQEEDGGMSDAGDAPNKEESLPQVNNKETSADKDKNESPDQNEPAHRDPLEELYEKELQYDKDLNGDGVIGAPEETTPAEDGDKLENDKEKNELDETLLEETVVSFR